MIAKLSLELLHIIHRQATEEGTSIFQGRLIDNNLCPLGLDALHNSLDMALTKIAGIRLHGKTIHADGHWFSLGFIIGAGTMVITCLFQYPIGDEIL